ncbi:hypothetical protein BBB57_02670 [Kosakonia sacchari]|nr:hypothetical protein BBB57_02670 [Kosakonia sacchari]
MCSSLMTGIAYPDALQGLSLKITQTYRNVLITTKIATKGKIFQEKGYKKTSQMRGFSIHYRRVAQTICPQKRMETEKAANHDQYFIPQSLRINLLPENLFIKTESLLNSFMLCIN